MRECGILLPISSLPSPYGIGSFSKEAYEFVDRLCDAGQSYWQILPLGPTGYGDSPYQSFSAFAGNPYFIDLDSLAEEGLLTEEECLSLIHIYTYHLLENVARWEKPEVEGVARKMDRTALKSDYCTSNAISYTHLCYMA